MATSYVSLNELMSWHTGALIAVFSYQVGANSDLFDMFLLFMIPRFIHDVIQGFDPGCSNNGQEHVD